MKSVPNRPAISNVLIKASANSDFRTRLLANPRDALQEMNLSAEDIEILASIRATTLSEFAQQVKQRLMRHRLIRYPRNELDLPDLTHHPNP